MHPLLHAIRESPSTYLPEHSLVALRAFLNGYLYRSAMEERCIDLGYDVREFHRWVCARFDQKSAGAIAETTLVSSFCFSEESAFREYFNLLDEFLQTGARESARKNFQVEKMTLFQTLRDIREKPALYIGHGTFLGFCSFLMGQERCCQDLRLPVDEDRTFFGEFGKWVESEKSQTTQGRPWFKVIQFWSGGIDLGTGKSGAFWLFFHWLDQFAKISGKEGLFQV
jgi:hypothetical protein